jgi:hypothetical protein
MKSCRSGGMRGVTEMIESKGFGGTVAEIEVIAEGGGAPA